MNRKSFGLMVCVALAGCATDDDGGDGDGADRGGPDALTGFMWKTTASQNGIDFTFGFAFDNTSVTASNTCKAGGQSLTATAATPVKYRYRAEISKAGHDGDASCFVDVAQGSFDFELVGDKLRMTSGGTTIEWSSAGGRSGLYGDWTAMADGLTLTWSMGGGKIRARAACPGGGSASVTVDAKFQNFVELVEAQSKTVGDDSFNCTVSIAKAMATYRFDGATLVLTMDGKDTKFTHE